MRYRIRRSEHIIGLISICIVFVLAFITQEIHSQVSQLSINRIDQMADFPSPYLLRDWKEVAIGYDSFVYNKNESGQYLPFVFTNESGVNYPSNMNFGLHTYVGTVHPNNGEGINVLPSIVGATLVGIDKSDQWGKNWVLMSQDFYNKNNQELVYLNGFSTHSGNDWWYDVMPNVFFYQINDLYPGTGDAPNQFLQVAERWTDAVKYMGGSETPWNKAFMDYRAWNLINMEGRAEGVHQPEAAGAIAWLLYNAYKESGEERFRKGAEWSMEFLSDWTSNPSYELQLPYGAYIAAKMNAELQTDYDIHKMVNWTFDRGPLRGWGVIKGIWGGVDVSGLVGEANDQGNDYAFQLNGVQQLGALVPMLRYDKRFADAIGKWALHLASATRFFYPGFLPASRQDASVWSQTYDPQGYIGYEALREKINDQPGPFSTGDAVKGGWAATNLSLYSSSSIGILGAIVSETNVDKILRLDLLATDFYRDEAYPSFLYYNPYPQSEMVEIILPDTAVDIYESLSETIVAHNVSQSTTLSIESHSAVLLVFLPVNGEVSYELNKMLVNDVIVDYMQTTEAMSFPPRIQGLAAGETAVITGDTSWLYGKATDPEQGLLFYSWDAEKGVLSGSGRQVQWIAPDSTGISTIQLIVQDEDDLTDTAILEIPVVEEINHPPQIVELSAEQNYIHPGGTISISCFAFDPNGDTLSYEWNADFGSFSGTGNVVNWTSPQQEGSYILSVIVKDSEDVNTSANLNILVRTFHEADTGNLIAHYPIHGNANDVSHNQLHGQVFGAKLTVDYDARSGEAYYFDGNNDRISVDYEAILNFQEGITVSCIFQLAEINQKEAFLLSHGSWQNRWKLSITPDQKLRWTVKTNTSIRDLDSKISIEPGAHYFVTATYDGEMMLLFIDGILENFRPHSGLIDQTSFDLLMGQMLPDMPEYNFKGTLDEIYIRDEGVDPHFVENLYEDLFSGLNKPGLTDPILFKLWPNPANDRLHIHLAESLPGELNEIRILDIQGHTQIKTEQERAFSNEDFLSIDISSLNQGIHIIILKKGRKYLFQKFMKI